MSAIINPRNVGEDGWELIEVTPSFQRFRKWVSDQTWVVKTEYLEDEELIALNQQEFNDSLTKRFNDDPLGTKVASIPLNIFYRDVAPRLREGDTDFMKWYLDHDNNRWMRTFRGTVSKTKKWGKGSG